MSAEHIVPVRIYLIIFVTLLVLTGVTTAVAYVNLGPLNVVVMLLIAFFKASLVILYFMHVRFTSRLTQVAAVSGFAWLAILIVLTLSDVLTRTIVP
jgi:cytochrome c oxidase subunit IV